MDTSSIKRAKVLFTIDVMQIFVSMATMMVSIILAMFLEKGILTAVFVGASIIGFIYLNISINQALKDAEELPSTLRNKKTKWFLPIDYMYEMKKDN